MSLFSGCLRSRVASSMFGFVLITFPQSSCVAALMGLLGFLAPQATELSVCLSAGISLQLQPSVGCALGPSPSWLISWVLLGLEPGSCSRSPSSTSTLRSLSRSRARWAAWEPFSSEPCVPVDQGEGTGSRTARAGCSYCWSMLLWHRNFTVFYWFFFCCF